MAVAVGSVVLAQQQPRPYRPITQDMLLNPSADDWLMFSRTYDAQRYSPLRQITRQNVNRLKLAWSKPMVTGVVESIPLVHDGVMFAMTTGSTGAAGGVLWALDATNGNLLWEFRRGRSEEHTSELQSRLHLVCRLLLEKKKKKKNNKKKKI